MALIKSSTLFMSLLSFFQRLSIPPHAYLLYVLHVMESRHAIEQGFEWRLEIFLMIIFIVICSRAIVLFEYAEILLVTKPKNVTYLHKTCLYCERDR